MDGCDRLSEPKRQPEVPSPDVPAAPAAQPLLALQRRAGNQAVNRLLQRSGGVPAGTVQRDLGFEFEINVPFLRPDDEDVPEGVPLAMQPTYAWLLGRGGLPKDVVHDFGYKTQPDGYEIVAEDGRIEDQVNGYRAAFNNDYWLQGVEVPGPPSIPEFVTSPIDERAEDALYTFDSQLTAVADMIGGYEDQELAARTTDLYGWTFGIPAVLGYPLLSEDQDPDDRPDAQAGLRAIVEARMDALRDAVSFDSYPQATVGIELDRVGEFLQTEDPDVIDDGDGDVLLLGRSVWNNVVRPIVAGPLNDLDLSDRELDDVEGFLSALTLYVAGHALWCARAMIGTTKKNLTPFWIRMDLSVYRDHLSLDATDALVEVADQCANALAAAHAQVQLTFPPQVVPATGAPLQAIADIRAFVLNVLTGDEDGLDEERPEDLDTIDGEQRGLPIELRSIDERPAPDELYEFAMNIVLKFREWAGIDDDD